MKIKIVLLLIFASNIIYCLTGTGKTISLTLNNPSSIDRKDEFVSILIKQLIKKDKNFDKSSFIILNTGKEIPYQVCTNEKNGEVIDFVIDIKSNETITLEIIYGNDIKKTSFQTRTYAELAKKKGEIFFDGKFHGPEFENIKRYKVPIFHKDHDALFKYEGPGWESEIIGYRFYLDWRNATDIFGKKKLGLILQNVGINDTVAKDDSYHTMQEWGMDIFKVGSSLGIGSIGMWYDGKVNMVSKTDSVICEISQNGPVKSEVTTNYYSWQVDGKKFDLRSSLSITAGSRLTNCKLFINNDADNIVTGLAKFEGTHFTKSNNTGDWQYISLYGKQSLANDDLGIALIYCKKDLIELTEDELSYVIKIKPDNSYTEYYFCAAWVQEPNGIKTEEEFLEYLNNTLIKLNNPLIIEL